LFWRVRSSNVCQKTLAIPKGQRAIKRRNFRDLYLVSHSSPLVVRHAKITQLVQLNRRKPLARYRECGINDYPILIGCTLNTNYEYDT
jgi:hypothetical protein